MKLLYIFFSELNRNHLLFLTYLIIVIIKEIINKFYRPTPDIISSLNKYFFYSISDLFSFIPMLIIKKRSESNKKYSLEKSSTSKSIKYLYSDTRKLNLEERVKRIFKLEIIISIFDFLGKYSNFIFYIIIAKEEYFVKGMELNAIFVFKIITMCILSFFILHFPFYKHHYFSLGINLIFLIVLVVIDQINIFKEEDWVFPFFYTLVKILINIFYTIEDVYGKVLLSLDSISPYNLLFYRGIGVTIISILFFIVLIFVEIPDENGEKSCIFTRYWKIFENKINILYAILVTITNFCYNINIFFIIDKFSPTHYAMANI